MAQITNNNHGLLLTGDVTPQGTIEAVSFTAYKINGTWVPFHKVHGAYPVAEALVVVR